MNDFFSNPLALGFIVLSAATLLLLILVIWMYIRQRRFLIGLHAGNIEESLAFMRGKMNDMDAFRKELETYLSAVEKRLRRSVQSVHTVRFNPFHGTGDGGNQSFATVLLNEDGDGVLISSLHSRDHIRVFSKPISGEKSDFELSEEEREALEKGLKNLR